MLEAVPVRLAAGHLCLPEGPIYQVLQILCMLIISDTEQRLRAIYHIGIGIETRYKLMGYGIPAEDIPFSSSMSMKPKNHQIWMKTRRAIDNARELGTPIDFVEYPGINDVVFRMGGVPKCQGNAVFRQMMDDVLPSYISPPTSAQRTWRRVIRKRLLASVKQKGGRFLGWNDGKWLQLNDVEANEKISNAIHNCIKRVTAKRFCQSTCTQKSAVVIDASERRKLEEEGCPHCVRWKY